MHSGLSHSEAVRLAVAVSEMVTDIVHFAFGPKLGTFEISFFSYEDRIEVRIHEFGVPFDPDRHRYNANEMISKGNFDGAGFRLVRNLIDNFVFLNKGREGIEFRFIQQKSPEHIAQQLAAAMREEPVHKAPDQTYSVEKATPHHAEEIARLIYRTYEHTYYKDTMYYPEKIEFALDQEEKFAVLARAENNEVVGYFAVVLSTDSFIGEVGEAVVALPHRRRGLMKLMLKNLIEVSAEKGLYGIFGEANAAHLFSQRANARFEFISTAILLGMCPPFNTEGIDPRYLHEPVSVVFEYKVIDQDHNTSLYLPPEYKNILKRIYKRMGFEVHDNRLPQQVFIGDTILDINIKYAGQYVEIVVGNFGTDFIDQLTRTIEDLDAQKFTTYFIDLPLEKPGTKSVISDLKAFGFIFSGVMPKFHGEKDFLRMQRSTLRVNMNLVLTHSPLARAIKKRIQSELL